MTKRTKKIWKICGGLLGVGAMACIIPACVVSCGSSNLTPTSSSPASPTTTTSNSKTTSTQPATPTTSTNQPTKNTTPTKATQSSSTKKVSEPNTPTPSYLKTNPYYILDNNNSSNFISESTTASPVNFYLGGITTPNTSVQQTGDTFNIYLNLNQQGASDHTAVFDSYKTTPTLLAIVPKANTKLTTTMTSDTTFTSSDPLLIQTIPGAPIQKLPGTDTIGLGVDFRQPNGGSHPYLVDIPFTNGQYNFTNTTNSFTVDVNGTEYTINLEINFSPYVVNATTPLTTSDFNLNTIPTTVPRRLLYVNGQTYRECYIHNTNYFQSSTTPWYERFGLPVPTPMVQGSVDWLPSFPSTVHDGGGYNLYLDIDGSQIINYSNIMTPTQWTNLIEALVNEAINSK